METATQWTRRVVVSTVLLAASGTMLLWSQADQRETKAGVKTVQENLRDKGSFLETPN